MKGRYELVGLDNSITRKEIWTSLLKSILSGLRRIILSNNNLKQRSALQA